jgi:hypothetical protein
MKVSDLPDEERHAFNQRAKEVMAERILAHGSDGFDALREHPELAHILGKQCGDTGLRQFRRLASQVRNEIAQRNGRSGNTAHSATNSAWPVELARAALGHTNPSSTKKLRLGRMVADWQADAEQMKRDAEAAWLASTAPDPGGPLGFIPVDKHGFQFACQLRKQALDLSMKVDAHLLATQNRAAVFGDILQAVREEVPDEKQRAKLLRRISLIVQADAERLG